MYPTGIGVSFNDPRRSNYTKTQSLAYSNGHVGIKDISETTANVAPHPTDMLGTNLRRGKGLTFQKGIAKFDGFVQGNSVSGSRPGSARAGTQASAVGRTQQDIVSSSRGPSLVDGGPGGNSSFRPGSASLRPGSGREQSVYTARFDGSRPSSSRPQTAQSSSRAFRPQSAPVSRRELNIDELPSWARDQLVAPSFAKTVENQKVRPSSARIRPGSGLPLSSIPKWISLDKKVRDARACVPGVRAAGSSVVRRVLARQKNKNALPPCAALVVRACVCVCVVCVCVCVCVYIHVETLLRY